MSHEDSTITPSARVPAFVPRVSLAVKIGGLAAVLLALGGIVTTHFFLSTSALLNELRHVSEHGFSILRSIEFLRSQHLEEHLALERVWRFGGLGVEQDPIRFKMAAEDFVSSTQVIDREIETLVGITNPEGEHSGQGDSCARVATLAREFAVEHGRFFSDSMKLLGLLETSRLDEAYALAAVLIPDRRHGDAKLLRLGELSQLIVETAASRSKAIRPRALLTSVAAAGLSLMIGLFLSFVVTRRLTDSVREMTDHAEEITLRLGREDPEFEEIPVRSSDEIGQLATSFNTMLASLKTAIKRRERLEAQLIHDALHDPVTSLPNRYLFAERLTNALRTNQRNKDWRYAVLIVEIEDFGSYSEGFGRAFADQLLIETATRLRSALRATDTFARIEDDSFGIFLSETRNDNEGVFLANRLLDSFMFPMQIHDREIFCRVSVGIASRYDGHEHAEDILHAAAIALARARGKHGQPTIEVFDPEIHASTMSQVELHADLRSAIDLKQVGLHFQPIVDLRSGSVAGFEALARWRHPTRGTVSPEEFIPIAEQTGLITPLGRQLIHKACQQRASWGRRHNGSVDKLSVSVNVSARQLSEAGLVNDFRNAIETTGIPPASIVIEITESAIIDDPIRADERLKQLHEMGIRIHIDDFGTGYASMSYLQRFPSDGIKIDRSFVAAMSEPGSYEIVRATISLAHHLNKKVIAEGVETLAQLEALRELDCDFGQGFLFSPPQAAQEAEKLLTSQQRW